MSSSCSAHAAFSSWEQALTFLQSFEDAGFGEDHFLSNVKLSMGALACIFALIAQFWPNPFKPMPFPESRPLLLVCTVLYALLSFALQMIMTFYEQDAILYTLPPNETSPFWNPLQKKRVKVSTRLPRFSINYTVTLEVKDGSGQVVDTHKAVLKLTDYFEENGTFHEDFFMEDIEALISALAAKKTQ